MKRFIVLALVAAALGLPARTAYAAPEAPIIVGPADGASICGSLAAASIVISGTIAGGVAVTVRVYEVGAEEDTFLDQVSLEAGESEWQIEATLGDGGHEVYAVANDGVEDSPHSAHVTFNVDAADRIGSVARSVSAFSPRNHDGYKDTVTFTTPVNSAGDVRYQVLKGATLVKQKTVVALEEGASAVWTWDGKGSAAYNGSAFVSSGTYTLKATWLRSGCDAEVATTSVIVDNVKPAVASFSDSPSTFYPRENDELTEFKDTVKVSWSGLSEPAYVKLYVYRNNTNDVVRVIDDGLDGDGGSGSVSWNGRTSSGTIFPAGTYEYALRLRDKVGNISFSQRGHVIVSHKVLDGRTATVKKDGEDYFDWYTNSGCADTDKGASDYPEGVWLFLYDCDDDIELLAMDWFLRVPSASYYHSFRVQEYGYSIYGNRLFALLYDYAQGGWIDAGVADDDEETHYLTTRYGKGYVRDDGVVRIRLAIGDEGFSNDYDIRDVGVKITYGVLVNP